MHRDNQAASVWLRLVEQKVLPEIEQFLHNRPAS